MHFLVKKNPNKFWNCVNSQVKSQNQIGKQSKINYFKTDSNSQKVATSNDFFSSVFVEESCQEVVEDPLSGIPNMDKLIINANIILDKVHDLKVDKSAGPDHIHPYTYTLI